MRIEFLIKHLQRGKHLHKFRRVQHSSNQTIDAHMNATPRLFWSFLLFRLQIFVDFLHKALAIFGLFSSLLTSSETLLLCISKSTSMRKRAKEMQTKILRKRDRLAGIPDKPWKYIHLIYIWINCPCPRIKALSSFIALPNVHWNTHLISFFFKYYV